MSAIIKGVRTTNANDIVQPQVRPEPPVEKTSFDLLMETDFLKNFGDENEPYHTASDDADSIRSIVPYTDTDLTWNTQSLDLNVKADSSVAMDDEDLRMMQLVRGWPSALQTFSLCIQNDFSATFVSFYLNFAL